MHTAITPAGVSAAGYRNCASARFFLDSNLNVIYNGNM